MSEKVIASCKEVSKHLIEIKYFAEKKNTSRTSVYRALYDKKLNEVKIGKNSRFIVLDESAKNWKPGRSAS